MKYTWKENGKEVSKDFDLDKYVKELELDLTRPEDILVIDCPRCRAPSFYDGGFTDSCSCCGYYNLADHSDDAYTLLDYWEMCRAIEDIFGKKTEKQLECITEVSKIYDYLLAIQHKMSIFGVGDKYIEINKALLELKDKTKDIYNLVHQIYGSDGK